MRCTRWDEIPLPLRCLVLRKYIPGSGYICSVREHSEDTVQALSKAVPLWECNSRIPPVAVTDQLNVDTVSSLSRVTRHCLFIS